jgi:hypothetical protein
MHHRRFKFADNAAPRTSAGRDKAPAGKAPGVRELSGGDR